MTKKPSITDVARLAGVSRTTVSYVLNDVAGIHISDKTRQRVLDAVRQLDYHPNAIARSLARKQTLTLGLVLAAHPDRLGADAFLPPVIYGVSSITSPAGFRLLVEVIDDMSRPNGFHSLIREVHIDGIILGGLQTSDEQLERLGAENFPVVLWGRIPESSLPFVDVDNVSAARMAVEHLIQLGHKRIACITNAPLRYPESAGRLSGYQAALAAHGLPYDEQLVQYGDYQERSGYQAMQTLLALPERPTAVFVASDVVALGALSAARTAGLTVPDNLAVIGFDDIQLAQYVVPALTSVRVPAREIGATGAQMLLNMIQTGQRPASVYLETELMVRESSGGHISQYQA